jgi:transcriptional regulator with XRE-family HTH domain
LFSYFLHVYKTSAMLPYSPLNNYLKALRMRAQLTQQELGQLVGVTKAAISTYEKGKATPSPQVLTSLAQQFDLSIDSLLGGLAAPAPSCPPALEVRQLPYLPAHAQAAFGAAPQPAPSPALRLVADVPAEAEFAAALLVEVPDDSMEPTLRAGARVLATPIAPEEWGYMASGVYCVVYRSTFVIKRIKNNFLLRQKRLLLHSDNLRAGAHPVRGEDIRAVWRVRWGVFAPIS